MKLFKCTDKQKLILLHDKNYIVNLAIRVGCNLNNDILKQCIEKEIERNEGLRLRTIKKNFRWYSEIVNEYDTDKFTHFEFSEKNENEIRDIIDKICNRKIYVINNFKPYEIYQISGDGFDYIVLRVAHVNMDAYGATFTTINILKEYFSIVNNTNSNIVVSSIEEYYKTYYNNLKEMKRKEKNDFVYFLSQDKAYGEQHFVGCNGMKDNKHNYFEVKNSVNSCKFYLGKFDKYIYDKCKKYALDFRINFCSLYLSLLDIYYSYANNKTNDITLAFNSDMRSKLFEKKLPITKSDALYFRNIFDIKVSFDEFIVETNRKYLTMLRHPNINDIKSFLYTVIKYRRPKLGTYFEIGVSYMNFDLTEIDKNTDFEAYWPKEDNTIDFPIYNMLVPNSKDELDVFYKYQDELISYNDIDRLHKGLIDIINIGMEDGSITLEEIMNRLESLKGE